MNDITHFHFEKAEDFLNAIAPRGLTFGNLKADESARLARQFIFRGVGNIENYKLVPSALREEFLEDHDETKNWNNLKQVCSEWRILKQFFECADSNGLPLPEDSQKLRQEIENFNIALRKISENPLENEDETNELVTEFPRSEFLTLLALAQHHGLPTRLLDWSRSAYTAAYFAATSAVKIIENGVNLAVWAFQYESFEWTSQLTHLPLQIITAPNAGNDHLKAQRGLFTLFRPDRLCWSNPVERHSFDAIAREIEGATFLKFTLPTKEAPTLLYLLSLEGVSGATIFPSYDGVVKAMRETQIYPYD